jgi:hypothetical protein
MDLSQYIDVPILCLVYLLAEVAKKTILKEDKKRGLIPVIGPIVGAVASIVIFIVWPEMSNSVNIFSAFANGVISGAAATGANQIYKQIARFFTPVEEENYE